MISDTRWKRWLAAAALLLLASPTPAQEAADPASAPAPAPEAQPAAPEPIPLASVAERAERLSQVLRQSLDRAAPAAEVEAIAADLDEHVRDLDRQAGETAAALAGRPTLTRLRDLERGWFRHRAELADWRRTLTRRASALESELGRLRETRAVSYTHLTLPTIYSV